MNQSIGFGNIRGKLGLVWQGLLLKADAFRTVSLMERPLLKGLGILLSIALILATAQALGLGLDLLVTPRLDLVQRAAYVAITNSELYARASAESADFVTEFEQIYLLVWEIIRILGGLPSILGMITVFLIGVTYTFASWFIYGSLVHIAARWLHGAATYRQFMAAFALSYAPQLLFVATLIPGLRVPAILVSLWLMAARYQAVKHSHSLSWGRNLAAILIPYAVFGLVLLGVILLGGSIALSQNDVINKAINLGWLIQQLQELQ